MRRIEKGQLPKGQLVSCLCVVPLCSIIFAYLSYPRRIARESVQPFDRSLSRQSFLSCASILYPVTTMSVLKCGTYFAVAAWFIPVYATAQSLPGGRFPLMAWDFAGSPKLLQSMHDAGINSVAFVRPDMLDACQNFDLKCIVFDERLAGNTWSKPFNGDQFVRNLPTLLEETKDKPAVYGYHIKDEPNATEFPELAKAVAAVKKMAPGKWPYINLLPGTSKEHEKYVSDFISICSHSALS
jgi:hypothetical protein